MMDSSSINNNDTDTLIASAASAAAAALHQQHEEEDREDAAGATMNKSTNSLARLFLPHSFFQECFGNGFGSSSGNDQDKAGRNRSRRGDLLVQVPPPTDCTPTNNSSSGTVADHHRRSKRSRDRHRDGNDTTPTTDNRKFVAENRYDVAVNTNISKTPPPLPPTAVAVDVPTVVEQSTNSSVTTDQMGSEYDFDTSDKAMSFLTFRLSYLFVTLVVMLADGLQGTHLYVLYEGYGFSVASLYCLGFITGAVTAPITGQLIDRFGRKKSALLYCALEVGINMLEQFPFLSGLIVSRVVGGVTTNLLSTVFEAWLDTEYRNRGFAQEEYEVIMRDSVVVSNLAAIASGYLAHVLAEKLGPVGPFEGAVSCTAVAFVVIAALWSENYGKAGGLNILPAVVENEHEDSTSSEGDDSFSLGSESSSQAQQSTSTESSNGSKNAFYELMDTVKFIRSDSRVLRICITQGLTLGTLHTFIFLWSPLLKEFTSGAEGVKWGMDSHGEPAYGLIFGAYMAAGVLGGLCSPTCRKLVTLLLSPLVKSSIPETVTVEDGEAVRPMDVEFQGAICYLLCAVLLFVPSLLSASNPCTFSISLMCFIAYEFCVGIYSPCEGVIRSIYIPPESRGTVMTVPSIIVNVAVALAVVSTEYIPRQTALAIISLLMLTCSILQLSLVSKKEWDSLFGRMEKARRASLKPLQSFHRSFRSVCSSTGDDADSIHSDSPKEKEE
eukprot:CAMPEP_0113501624 /NCGR_PEP_ID=MMETSP0014_2-20120614/33061_1 /TAXON_ID=2857 /ORGANISM="Nitzschia sp." /LENGTH=722 /DNA_ID=CAMNT_0000396239 /DNA_START=158 /DNA_END=2326 /DNA_ORIENTATION=- /assembly_acc=CAM_ASM_000159